MRYALINGVRLEPSPRLMGLCVNCGAVMIAKCGRHKIWHWAHKSRIHCDRWWEPETDWHRAWKNEFPNDWQEVTHFDPLTGEKHVADVKTASGRVIEFQHSPMKPEELKAREEFYQNLVWIVDGNRGELDVNYFRLGLGKRQDAPNHPTIFPFAWYGRSKLFEIWWAADCPVFIDFGDPVVWRLALYDRQKKGGVVGPILREDLIKGLIEGQPLTKVPGKKHR